MERRAFVYLDKPDRPVLVGRLWSRTHRGRETATFEYDEDWLASAERFALEPALTLAPGPFHVGAEKGLLGAIGDSAPRLRIVRDGSCKTPLHLTGIS